MIKAKIYLCYNYNMIKYLYGGKMKKQDIYTTNNNKVYTYEKIKGMLDNTISNSAATIKRLERRKNFSNFILIYYSLITIIYTLTLKFFDNSNIKLSEYSNTLDYFGIIFSIIMLVYSVINSNRNYETRITKTKEIFDKLIDIKRTYECTEADNMKNEYDKIISNLEMRSDEDFFKTLRQKCRKLNVKWYYKPGIYKQILLENDNKRKKQLESVYDHLNEISRSICLCKIVLEYILYITLISFPLGILIMSFY